MEPSTNNTRTVRIISWVAVISSWLTFPFFFAMPFAMLFWIGVLVYLFIKKSNFKWLLLLVSTWTIFPVWSFTTGSMAYFQGRGVIKTFGLPSHEFYNLDPGLRTWHSTSGCIVLGFEPLIQVPNNLAVRFCTSIFGIQKNAYKGAYPTKQQAKDIISKGESVSVWEQSGVYKVSYKNELLPLRTVNHDDLRILENTTTAKAFILENECILIESLTDNKTSDFSGR